MVNIQTVKAAISGLSKVQKVALSVGGVGGLGLSILIPSIIGKRKKLATFEKDNAALQAERNALQAQCDSLQNELNKLNEKAVKHPFEYTPEREYAVSDTTFKAGKPESIDYFKNADKRWGDNVETVYFKEDGSIKRSHYRNHDVTWTIDGTNYDKQTIEYKDENGKLIQRDCFSKKGDYVSQAFDDGNIWHKTKGNDNTDVEISTYYPAEYTSGGKVLYRRDSDAEITYTNKKTGRDIKIKQMKDGVLDYTVVPKYDKDGIVVQRDTIWNNQKKP
ncbi:MAG: hypothetical protein MJ231_05660 [bacterium]|nr:hypothetical protein [bacterium]